MVKIITILFEIVGVGKGLLMPPPPPPPRNSSGLKYTGTYKDKDKYSCFLY